MNGPLGRINVKDTFKRKKEKYLKMTITEICDGIINFLQSCVDELVAFLVVGLIALMAYQEKIIPEALWAGFGMILTFYFVKKIQNNS